MRLISQITGIMRFVGIIALCWTNLIIGLLMIALLIFIRPITTDDEPLEIQIDNPALRVAVEIIGLPLACYGLWHFPLIEEYYAHGITIFTILIMGIQVIKEIVLWIVFYSQQKNQS